MKILILLFTLSISITSVNAQNHSRDSLLNLLASEKEDTLQVNIYQHLTNSYFNDFKFDSARLLATQGLELAQKVGYKKGEMRIKSLLARLSYSVGDFATAIELDYSLLEYAILMHDTDLEHAAYINITNTYRDQGEYREALTFMWKLMNNDSIYYDCSQCGIGYSAIGSNYYGLKMYDSALYYANKGLAYPKDFSYGWQLLMKGRVLEKLNQYKEAFDYFHRSIAELRNNGYSKDLAGVYSSIGDLFIKINQTDSAIYYGNLALDLAYKRSYNKELLEAYLLLAKANEQINKSDALQYYRRAMNLKDSLFNKDKQKQISSARFNEILRQNEIKNSEAEYKNQLRFNALIGSTFTLIIIAIFLFWNNRAKQKAKKKIEAAYDQLKSTQSQLIQSEKMASLGELTAGIAHEIQNPLNFVNNFSEVNTELIDEAGQEIDKGNVSEVKAILNDLKANEEKINHHGKRADAIVKGMLQHSSTSSGVKEPTDINALADEYLRLAYHGLRAKNKSFNAKFETDFDSSIPKINVVPQDIGRVVLNLINNAFYAVNEKQKTCQAEPVEADTYHPQVTVSTKDLGDKIQITVKDNGNGIPDSIKEKIFQPFFTTKPTGQGTGLGLSLSYDVVKAHGGELKVETKDGGGSTFVVLLSKNKLPV